MSRKKSKRAKRNKKQVVSNNIITNQTALQTAQSIVLKEMETILMKKKAKNQLTQKQSKNLKQLGQSQSQLQTRQVQQSKSNQSSSKNNSSVTTIMAKKKLPLHVKVAIDLYINKLSFVDVANKYNRTRRQISWLNAKSIKSNLNDIWQFGHKKSRYLQITQDAPLYMQVAAERIDGTSVADIARKHNKTATYIKRIISTSIKKKLPYLYQFITV